MAATRLPAAGLAAQRRWPDGGNIIAEEDFYTATEALFRTNPGFGTAPRRQRSLVLSGEKRDETSLRHGRPSTCVAVLRTGRSRPAVGGRVSHGPQRDRAPRGAAVGRGPADPVHAGCEPGEMAQGPHHLVLGAISARRAHL